MNEAMLWSFYYTIGFAFVGVAGLLGFLFVMLLAIHCVGEWTGALRHLFQMYAEVRKYRKTKHRNQAALAANNRKWREKVEGLVKEWEEDKERYTTDRNYQKANACGKHAKRLRETLLEDSE